MVIERMIIHNPKELVGKQVFDINGTEIGTIDKTWQSWNHEYPGWFFGIRPNENTRCTYFRGTNKLVPIYSDYIKEFKDNVHLTKTVMDLSRFWNKTVLCGPTTWPTDHLMEKSVFDKNHCRIGTFCSWVEGDDTLALMYWDQFWRNLLHLPMAGSYSPIGDFQRVAPNGRVKLTVYLAMDM